MTSNEYQEAQAGAPPCARCGEAECKCEAEQEARSAEYERQALELGYTTGPAEVFAAGALWRDEQLAQPLTKPYEQTAADFEEERNELEEENAALATELQSAHDRIAELEDRLTGRQRERCGNPKCSRELPRDGRGRAFVWFDTRRGLAFCSHGCCEARVNS